MNAESDAEIGLFRRLDGDALLTSLLGADDRIIPGWPSDTLESTDVPRLTFYVFGPSPRAKGTQRVRATVDEWVWPSGTNGGRSRLLAIDARVSALMDEQHFAEGSSRIYSIVGGFRDFPAGPGSMLRRTREITLEASPL